MDEMNTQANQSCTVDIDKIGDDKETLLQMVISLSEEVRRLSERIEQLEQTPKQSKCILCPTIRINFPITFKIPLGCTTNTRE